jgi:ketosteroid isomerase-like protein
MAPSHTRSARPLILAAGLIGLAGATLASPANGPAAVVRESFDAFNRGDMAAVQATLAPEVSIVDNFAPHEWHGPNALQSWGSDFDKMSKAKGLTDGKIVNLSVIRTDVDGDTAYVVIKADFNYRLHGRRTSEPGKEAVSLRKGEGGWKITGWGWAGDVPHAVVAKPKAPTPPKT